jgi:hypothetical protein
MVTRKTRSEAPLGPRWTDIGSDVNWLDYGGLWARHISGPEWHVIQFWNDGDPVGSGDRYGVTLSEVLLTDERLGAALECTGQSSYANDPSEPEGYRTRLKVEALHTYGARRMLGSFQGNNAHKLLRAARRAS